jgi:hypothetical protein
LQEERVAYRTDDWEGKQTITDDKESAFFRFTDNENIKSKKKKRSYPRNRPWRPMGLWDVKDPTLF